MRSLMLLLAAALALCFSQTARAEEPEVSDLSVEEGVSRWLDEIDWGDWEEELRRLPEEVRGLWNGLGSRDMARRIAESGDAGDPFSENGKTLEALSGLLSKELKSAAGFFALLLGVIMLSGACMALTGDKSLRVAEVGGMVCRCMLLMIVLTSFSALARSTVGCIGSLGAFMELSAPVLMTLLTAMGGTASVGVFQPAMSLLCTTVTGVVERIIVPLALCGGVLGLIDRLSERMRVGEFAGLLQSASKWTVGVLTTVYVAATSIRSMTAAAFDGVSIRAARYAAGSMVPMFGSLVSGSFDTMLGCAVLVKNAVGLTSMLLVAGTIALPMLRLLAYLLLLRVSAAIAQPLAGAQQAAMLKAGAGMIGSLLSACTAVALMFVVTLGLITGLGNAGYL